MRRSLLDPSPAFGLLRLLLAIGLAVWLAPEVAGLLGSGLRIAADLLWPGWLPGGLLRIDPVAGQGWRVHTGWPIVDAAGQPSGEAAIFFVSAGTPGVALRGALHLLLIVALLGAPRWRRLGLALFAFLLLAWLQLTLGAWHTSTVLRAGVASAFTLHDVQPPFRLAMPPLPAWHYQFSGYAATVLPKFNHFVLPLLVALWVCPGSWQHWRKLLRLPAGNG